MPLNVVGWWLSPGRSHDACALLGMPPPDRWRQGGLLESAHEAVHYAWSLEAGGIRPGDSLIIVLPGFPDSLSGPARHGIADDLEWDAPYLKGGQLPMMPAEVYVIPPGAARGTARESVAAYRVLLNMDLDRGEAVRARVITARAASKTLDLAFELYADRPREVHDWFRRRAGYYPACIAGALLSAAADEAGMDEIALAQFRVRQGIPSGNAIDRF